MIFVDSRHTVYCFDKKISRTKNGQKHDEAHRGITFAYVATGTPPLACPTFPTTFDWAALVAITETQLCGIPQKVPQFILPSLRSHHFPSPWQSTTRLVIARICRGGGSTENPGMFLRTGGHVTKFAALRRSKLEWQHEDFGLLHG